MKSTTLHSINGAAMSAANCWPDCVEDSFERIISHVVAIAELPADCGSALMDAAAEQPAAHS